MKNNFNDTVNNFFKNYQDRGMKKWQGFMLSDHIVALNKDKEEQAKVYSEKDTMSEAEISQVLLQAFANNKVVSVQLKEKTLDKKIQPDIVGLVKGYNGDKIVISDVEVELSNINHIEIRQFQIVMLHVIIFLIFKFKIYKKQVQQINVRAVFKCKRDTKGTNIMNFIELQRKFMEHVGNENIDISIKSKLLKGMSKINDIL